eukprot:12907473-Prorocentrum_lima.AAC.1
MSGCQTSPDILVFFLGADVSLSHDTDSPYHHAIQHMKAMSTTTQYFGLLYRDGSWALSTDTRRNLP